LKGTDFDLGLKEIRKKRTLRMAHKKDVEKNIREAGKHKE